MGRDPRGEDVGVTDRALGKLIRDWRAEAGVLRERYGLDALAQLCETHATELSAAVARQQTELLTLGAAAEYSGYSTSHLRALVANGTLTNVGRKGSPRLLQGELPQKSPPTVPQPQQQIRTKPRVFDAAAAAAGVAARFGKKTRHAPKTEK